jgi:hypothetical protein
MTKVVPMRIGPSLEYMKDLLKRWAKACENQEAPELSRRDYFVIFQALRRVIDEDHPAWG